jgi:hypothetical protein
VLVHPVCTTTGEKIALSRKVDKHWRLIGWGTIADGKRVEMSGPEAAAGAAAGAVALGDGAEALPPAPSAAGAGAGAEE